MRSPRDEEDARDKASRSPSARDWPEGREGRPGEDGPKATEGRSGQCGSEVSERRDGAGGGGFLNGIFFSSLGC